MEELDKLNAPQREAVVTTEGPLLVLAGAGSGKTRVITHRIVYLLQKKKVKAHSILAVTFTNKAASEMRERVKKMVGKKANGVTLCTFHAFGAEVLREHIHMLGYPKKLAIADMGDQLSIVKRAMRERSIDDRAFDARKVLTLISRAKNSGVEPQPKPEGMGDDYDLITHLVFPLYQLSLKAQGVVDFDDLIVYPSTLFEKHPTLRQEYRDRFTHVMVDEYQDTNHAQMQLLKNLVPENGNLCVVGDDDQCIYSWRGAEVRNILQFDRHYPTAKEVRLEQNYRSTGAILNAANAVIDKNPERKDKRMWTDEGEGRSISIVVAPDDDEEARYVAKEIDKATAEGLPRDEIAILYRTNGQSRPFEEALRTRDIGYQVIGGTEFFDRREIKDVIAYFKVISNARDDVSLLRIVNVPARGIGDVTLAHLSQAASTAGKPLWETLLNAKDVPGLQPGAAERVEAFCALITKYREIFSKGNLSQATRALLEEVDFVQAARASNASVTVADRKVRLIEQVLQSLETFESREGHRASLWTYLNTLSLDTREEEEGPRKNCVTMVTLHGAKGLEWRLVFLVGMEEDLLPHSGMQGEPPNLEEERRLAYVGMTRARQKLVLTRAATRVKRGKPMPRTPSRYLSDLPEDLIELHDLTQPPPGPPSPKELDFFASLKNRLKNSKGSPEP